MVATTRKAWSSKLRTGAAKPAGKWAKTAAREGEVVKHPNGKWVARRLGFSDSHHDNEADAHAKVKSWAESMKKFSQI